MRIITGRYKGRNLFSVEGRTTRPTTAYNRAMIFSVYSDYEGKRVLDLFAGTGSFGLEALSRGAVWADLVEFATPAVATILRNINLLGCGSDCHLWRKRADAFLKSSEDSWDVIFLDPPYAKEEIMDNIQQLCQRKLLAEDVMVVCETDKAVDLPEEIADLGIWKQKVYGISKVTVYVR